MKALMEPDTLLYTLSLLMTVLETSEFLEICWKLSFSCRTEQTKDLDSLCFWFFLVIVTIPSSYLDFASLISFLSEYRCSEKLSTDLN